MSIPDYWLAVDDFGQVLYGQDTDDGNGGEVARQAVNEWINEQLDQAFFPIHAKLVPANRVRDNV